MNGERAILIGLGMIITMALSAQGTTAEDYFNLASKEYVKEDKMKALRTLDKGLDQYPDDARLLKLAEELIKEEEKNQQKQDQQEKQDQEKKDQEQKENDKGQDQKEQEEQDRQKKEQEQKEKEQQEQQENGDKGQEKEQNTKPEPGTIAPQDAMRMLDALERSEQDVQEKVRAKLRPVTRRSIEKDW